MNSILLYIEPDENERQSVVQQAADLVEAMTFQIEAPISAASIGVVAEPSVCLEIGLSMLGRGQARTVEGGERRASPLMLFPFVSEEGREWGEIQLLRGGESEGDEFGTLNDLVSFGAIEPDLEFSLDQASRPGDVLERVLRLRSWQSLVVMASDHAFERMGPRLQTHARIVNSRDLKVNQDRVYALIERLEPMEDEALFAIRRQAVTQALQLESFMIQLGMLE